MIWKLLHIFGFVSWFVGLLATTSLQVAARKADDATARQTTWASIRRFYPYEIVGMVLTPLSGFLLANAFYGAVFPSGVIFIHIKLLLVLLAAAGNIALFRLRAGAAALSAEGGPAYQGAMRRLAAVQGITTIMLPAAVIVVVVMKYS